MRKGTTKSQGKKHDLDKFYTKPEMALECINFVGLDDYDVIIEPSAGSGSFSKQIPGCLAMDIHPEDPSILRQNWLEYTRNRTPGERVLILGNPPFTYAIKFINHAAEFADTIAFILPLSFKKYSVQDKLDRHLHRRSEFILPTDSFTLDGEPYNTVRAVFQVWDWKEEERQIRERRLTSPHFHFVKKDDSPDCRIQRIGGSAGRASLDTDRSHNSNYFIKIDSKLTPSEFVDFVNTLHYPGRSFGVGPRSLSKDELISVFEENIGKRKI